MNLLDKLERKFGKYAIRNLMVYITATTVAANVVRYLLQGQDVFSFDMEAILSGQIWRIFTFLFAEYYGINILFLFLFVQVYCFIGSTLEAIWGTFKFNVYYFTGALSSIAACVIAYLLGANLPASAFYLHLSLFLAFATLCPDYTFRILFLIPVKVKYLAVIDALALFLGFIMPGIVNKILITVSLLNYFLFFGLPYLKQRRTKPQKDFIKTKRKLSGSKTINAAFHKCTVCGQTELDDPTLEFRYCSSCNGNYEYCMEHLKNHTHKQ